MVIGVGAGERERPRPMSSQQTDHRMDRAVTGIDHRALWKVLERFAGTLVARDRLDDVLEQLGVDLQRVLSVAGASVMCGDDQGNLRFTSTSDGLLHQLEALQFELDEGPCLLAYRSSAVVLAEDLRADERFPRFGPRAVEAGMAAVYSFPMHVDQQVFGALNLYNADAGPFSQDQVEVGRTLADIATAYLMNARDIEQMDQQTRQLRAALDNRVVIEQAKGYVSATLSVGLSDAFELIRAYARRHQIRVRVVARAVMHGDVGADELTRD
jgi:GAF domain-containing protein